MSFAQDILDDLVELDIKLNQLGGGERETISARLGRRVANGKATPHELALCQLLEILEPSHCLKSYARTMDRPRRRRRVDHDEEDSDIAAILGGR